MKRTMKAVALLFFLSVVAPAQEKSNKSKHYDTTPYTEIVDINWTDRWSGFRWQYVPSIKLRNIGDKVIASVTWEYQIVDRYRTNSSGQALVADRFTFKSEDKIKPSETKKLSQRIDHASLGSNYSVQARVIKLSFADGSFWDSHEKGSSKPE